MVKRFYSFDSIPVVRPEGVVNNSNQHSLGDRTIETVGEVRSESEFRPILSRRVPP